MWPENALKAVILKIVCKTFFSPDVRDLNGQTMF